MGRGYVLEDEGEDEQPGRLHGSGRKRDLKEGRREDLRHRSHRHEDRYSRRNEDHKSERRDRDRSADPQNSRQPFPFAHSSLCLSCHKLRLTCLPETPRSSNDSCRLILHTKLQFLCAGDTASRKLAMCLQQERGPDR